MATKLLADMGLPPIQAKAPATDPRLIISIRDRLECGNLTIVEVRQLKPRSKTGFYSDLKAGLVSIQKIGRKSVVPGAVAARYIAGEPINPTSTDPTA